LYYPTTDFGNFVPLYTTFSGFQFYPLSDYAHRVISLKIQANGPSDMIFVWSLFLSALFKFA